MSQLNRIIRAAYKRLGIIHVGRRRVRDLIDFIEDRGIDLVIDVGANIGQFGESLRAGGYRGRIVSFEPIAAAFQTLARKAAADGNWKAHHCGLGAAPGTATLHVSGLSECSSILDLNNTASLHDSRIATDHTQEIQIQALDQVAASLTGKMLLKIDTQGYEQQVISGGAETIQRVLGILMELPVIHVYAGEWRFHEAIEYMSGLGFVPAQIQPVGFHGKDNVSAVEFDCLFRPRGEIDGPLAAEKG
ncbi:MAG: FkbM family methyltransferase [Terracidiphilus sp.]